ncbi:MAG: cytochrome B [Nitrospirae bacterium]|nr:MAG: cytochrome B [Nitrospirota bacterium]
MKKIFLQPLTVRIWHWINALCFFALIVTGLQLRYQELPNITSFRTAVDIHNLFGLIMTLDFFLWLAFYIFTGKIRLYIPLDLKKFFTGAFAQALYYGYGIFLGKKNPHHATPDDKFNPLQQSAYFMVMLLLMPLQIITGLFLWDIKRFAYWIGLLGGLKVVDITHVAVFFFLTAFLFVHVYLTTLGRTPWEHIKAMFTGYEEMEENGK